DEDHVVGGRFRIEEFAEGVAGRAYQDVNALCHPGTLQVGAGDGGVARLDLAGGYLSVWTHGAGEAEGGVDTQRSARQDTARTREPAREPEEPACRGGDCDRGHDGLRSRSVRAGLALVVAEVVLLEVSVDAFPPVI